MSKTASTESSATKTAPQENTKKSSKKKSDYLVLARKYRPRNFAELKGQDALVRTLTNAIDSGRIAHAFMMTGVRGVGKTTTARIIARSLNCVGEDGNGGPTVNPCGVCEQCKAIAEDRHVDVIEMDAASRNGVDDVREIVDAVQYAPASARYKIFILDEVHMLSKAAFNALLKTLEEPPEHVKFIFATTEIRKVPVTVLSRCQRFDLRRIDSAVLQEYFAELLAKENVKAEDAAIALIARAADGSARDGLSLLDQAISREPDMITEAQVREMLGLADRNVTMDLFEAVLKGDTETCFTLLSDLHKSGADPIVILQDMLDLTHFVTKAKVAPEIAKSSALPEAEKVRGATMALSLPVPVLTRTWQILLKGAGEVQNATLPQQALEMVMIRLLYAADLPAPGDLVKKIQEEGVPATTGNNGAGNGGGRPAGATVMSGGNGATAALSSNPQAVNTSPAVSVKSIEDVVALCAENKDMMLHAHITQFVHPVKFEQGHIALRLAEGAPRDLVGRISSRLSSWTGMRWVVSVSTERGEQTLAQQQLAVQTAEMEQVKKNPVVAEILNTFPGSNIINISDYTNDE